MNTPIATDTKIDVQCTSNQSTCSDCKLTTLCIPLALKLDDIERLESIVSKGRPVEKNVHIFQQEHPFKEIYAVRLGSIKTYRVDEDGSEQVTGFYLPGEIFGLDGIASQYHGDNAIALETSAVCAIPFERLSELSADLPSLQGHMFKLMSQEILEDRKLISMLGKHSAEERMAAFILSLSQRYSERGLSSTEIRLPMSRGDIANFLGLTPETVSRTLNKLRKQEIISIDQREMQILDTPRLRLATVES